MQTLADLSRVRARDNPDAPAMVFEGEVTTYGELDERANRVANALLALDLPPQSRIGYLAKNAPSYFEIILGCARSRHVMVGINTRLAAPEIEYIAADAGLRVLFAGREFYAPAEKIAPAIEGLETIVALDGGHDERPAYRDWIAAAEAGDPQIEADPDDDFEQLYTSGTTGRPKGVRLTHSGWLPFARAVTGAGWASYAPGETALVCMPVFHVAGSNTGLLALLQGARVVIMAEVDPQEILRLLHEHRIQHAFFVPAVILALTMQPNVRDYDYSHLKVIAYGASPIAQSVLENAREIFGCDFVQLYGLTENFGAATYLPPEDHAPERGKLRSCGVPYEGAEMRIVDADGRVLGPNEVGEIELRSSWLMKGYWKQPDATEETLQDGWLRTGDAGCIDEDGYLYIHDRLKDMIVSGGENVYPAEVENAVHGHPAVADVAVIGVPDERWGEAVKAVVVLKGGEAADAEAIVAWTRERIAGYKTPKSVEFVDALPRNASGKVLRRELRERYWKGRDRRVG